MSMISNSIRVFGKRDTWHFLRDRRGINPLILIAFVSGCLVVRAHFLIGLSGPLWLDESWTLAIASSKSFYEFIHQAHEEAGGPIYYFVTWAWSKLFGISNVSLHIPNLILSLATPIVAYLGIVRVRKHTATIWAILIATWIPGIIQSGIARCYPLLLILSVVLVIIHFHFVEKACFRNAFAWATVSSIMVLTHYYASVLVVVQMISIIAVHRRKIFPLIPSMIVFIPPIAWIAWGLPRLALMNSLNYAWIKARSIYEVPDIIAFVLGIQNYVLLTILLLAIIALTFVRQRLPLLNSHALTDEEGVHIPALVIVGLSALTAGALIIFLGLWRPILTERYLFPFVPGTLLILALWIEYFSAGRRLIMALMIGILLSFSSGSWLSSWRLGALDFNFEVASQWLSKKSPNKMVFFWDNPTALTVSQDQMDLVGGVFLQRSGIDVRTHTLYPLKDTDMNNVIIDNLASNDALMWIYDLGVDRTTAISYPPRIEKMRSDLECKDFGRDGVGIFVCRRI